MNFGRIRTWPAVRKENGARACGWRNRWCEALFPLPKCKWDPPIMRAPTRRGGELVNFRYRVRLLSGGLTGSLAANARLDNVGIRALALRIARVFVLRVVYRALNVRVSETGGRPISQVFLGLVHNVLQHSNGKRTGARSVARRVQHPSIGKRLRSSNGCTYQKNR